MEKEEFGFGEVLFAALWQDVDFLEVVLFFEFWIDVILKGSDGHLVTKRVDDIRMLGRIRNPLLDTGALRSRSFDFF